MNTPKVYLGDGVYAAVDDQLGVVLTTENGLRTTNTIVLEPDVVSKFLVWVGSLSRAMKNQHAKGKA